MKITHGVMATVWRRGAGGKFGDGAALVDHEIGPCVMQWGTTADVDGGPGAGDDFRDGDYVDCELFGPAGADVIASDILEVDGVRYRVQGRPLTQRFARSGRTTNTVVRLREVSA
ncbi:hypothetical protein [Nocardia brasiliensis]|uniref:hypothetical protein n=1 Tax=Nocardia brasiliensis TaxID=37326 RepID=UPI002453EE7B|nr:hypothetical protein [Nocardia brasiliensis]